MAGLYLTMSDVNGGSRFSKWGAGGGSASVTFFNQHIFASKHTFGLLKMKGFTPFLNLNPTLDVTIIEKDIVHRVITFLAYFTHV